MTPALGWTQAASENGEVAADLQRGQAALRANNQAAAKAQFEAALKLDPDNPEAHANLGVIAFFRGDCPVAEQEFQSTLHAAPSLTKAQALLSICEKRLRQPAAQADLESAYAKLDDAKLKTQVGVELADVYYQQGDLDKTAFLLHGLLETNADNVDILFFAQRVYTELADNTLSKLAVLAPGSARMEQLIAERLINAGDSKGAAEHYRKALEISPRLPGMHYELAETLLEASPNDAATQAAAKKELQEALRVDGDSAKAEALLGRIGILQDNAEEATAHYKRAYELNPQEAQAQMGLAELLESQGKHEEAAVYLRMAVAADPFQAEAHYKLARVDKELHLDEEQKREMELFLQIKATKDRMRVLYGQMNPHSAARDGNMPQDTP